MKKHHAVSLMLLSQCIVMTKDLTFQLAALPRGVESCTLSMTNSRGLDTLMVQRSSPP